jgi:selenocysteine lyase/cysteine desulfurase
MPAWEADLRAKFPALRHLTYLNSAAAGPLTLATARAGFSPYEAMLQGGDQGWREQVDEMEESRAALAALAGATADELAFTRNTSHSVSIVAELLWAEGLRTAVVLEDEFPASTIPLLHRGFDVRFVRASNGRYSMADIEAALEGRHLLVASHVMYRTGFALDPAALARLCEAKGARLLVCVTQSLGALAVDFRGWGADYLVGTSHKWLCGGYGGGFVAVREARWGRWPMVGWLSQRHAGAMRNDVLDLDPRPRAMEMGCQPVPSILAVGAAARLWLETGVKRVDARVRALSAAFRRRLREAGFEAPDHAPAETSGITVVPVAKAMEVAARLEAERVSTTPRGAGVRFAVHAFNDERDLDRAVEALARVTAGPS